jgi:hypothetical protein
MEICFMLPLQGGKRTSALATPQMGKEVDRSKV